MIGRIILVVLSVLTGMMWSKDGRSQSANEPEITTQNADKSQQKQPFSIPVRILDAPIDELAKEENRERDRRESGYAEKNISIQEVVAKASEEVAHYTYFQLWISGASMIGLAITIWFTFAALVESKKATKEAQRSTKIAEATLTETHEMAKIQLRPYLTLDTISSGAQSDGRVVVAIVLINNGQTPAFINFVTNSVNIHKDGEDIPNNTLESGKTNITVGPHRHNTFSVQSSSSSMEPRVIIEGIKKGHLSIIVTMEIHYTDIFNHDHKTSFTRKSDIVDGRVEFMSDFKTPDVST